MSPDEELELFSRLKAMGLGKWVELKLQDELSSLAIQPEMVGVYRAQGRVGLLKDLHALLAATS